MTCQYVKDYYRVPADIGRRVVVDGKAGIIVENRGNHIGVNFDSDKPCHVTPCHPTWRVEYGEIGKARPISKSQQRYKRFQEYGDGFNSFIEFCYWDASPERSWNKQNLQGEVKC